MKERVKELNELMSLALRVNTETDYCVFADISGHVNWIEFRIRRSKENYESEIKSFTFGYNKVYENEEEREYSLENFFDISMEKLELYEKQ